MKHPLDNQTVDWVENRMVPNLTQVRQALKLLAERKGRPDYELCTAKEVKCALEHGLEHPLFKELPFFELEPKQADKPLKPFKPAPARMYPTDEELSGLVAWLKDFNGMQKDIADLADCSPSSISYIRTGRKPCSLEMYNKLNAARKQLEGEAA
ncbi:hypothetical protein [Acinetobacter higginsii]|uniref:hypothetical protein n=1 Tax=Acinetobacter higginsii TaxID=70347 RepID=UPI00300B2065